MFETLLLYLSLKKVTFETAYAMIAISLAELESLIASLGIDESLPSFPASDAVHRPVDIYRVYLASIASKCLEVPVNLAYEAVQVVPAGTLKDNSDLDLVLPRLKLKSENPKQIAHEVSSKVRCLFEMMFGGHAD